MGLRYYRNVGPGFKTPKEAIEGTYIDKKCPFTGNVAIRGRIFRGIVASAKMHRTVIVRRDYLHYVKKYIRFEKRHSNVPAHVSPCFRISKGQVVTIGQCRPLQDRSLQRAQAREARRDGIAEEEAVPYVLSKFRF